MGRPKLTNGSAASAERGAKRQRAQEFDALQMAWRRANDLADYAQAQIDVAWMLHQCGGAPPPTPDEVQFALAVRAEAVRRGEKAAAFMRSRPL